MKFGCHWNWGLIPPVMARFHPGKLMTNQMIPGGSCWNTPADTASPIREEAPWAGIPKCFPGENPMVSHIRMVDFPHLCYWLVVYLPLWKIWKSVGVIIPNIWKNKTCSKPPTSLISPFQWCLMVHKLWQKSKCHKSCQPWIDKLSWLGRAVPNIVINHKKNIGTMWCRRDIKVGLYLR